MPALDTAVPVDIAVKLVPSGSSVLLGRSDGVVLEVSDPVVDGGILVVVLKGILEGTRELAVAFSDEGGIQGYL